MCCPASLAFANKKCYYVKKILWYYRVFWTCNMDTVTLPWHCHRTYSCKGHVTPQQQQEKASQIHFSMCLFSIRRDQLSLASNSISEWAKNSESPEQTKKHPPLYTHSHSHTQIHTENNYRRPVGTQRAASVRCLPTELGVNLPPTFLLRFRLSLKREQDYWPVSIDPTVHTVFGLKRA